MFHCAHYAKVSTEPALKQAYNKMEQFDRINFNGPLKSIRNVAHCPKRHVIKHDPIKLFKWP